MDVVVEDEDARVASAVGGARVIGTHSELAPGRADFPFLGGKPSSANWTATRRPRRSGLSCPTNLGLSRCVTILVVTEIKEDNDIDTVRR